MLLEVLPATYD